MAVIKITSLDAVGPELRRIRKSKGLTQEDVSRRMDISMVTLSKIEKGGNVSINTLSALQEFYQCKICMLIATNENDYKRLMEVNE